MYKLHGNRMLLRLAGGLSHIVRGRKLTREPYNNS